MDKKSQVEYGPEVPGYALLNEQLRTQSNKQQGRAPKARKPRKKKDLPG